MKKNLKKQLHQSDLKRPVNTIYLKLFQKYVERVN